MFCTEATRSNGYTDIAFNLKRTRCLPWFSHSNLCFFAFFFLPFGSLNKISTSFTFRFFCINSDVFVCVCVFAFIWRWNERTVAQPSLSSSSLRSSAIHWRFRILLHTSWCDLERSAHLWIYDGMFYCVCKEKCHAFEDVILK